MCRCRNILFVQKANTHKPSSVHRRNGGRPSNSLPRLPEGLLRPTREYWRSGSPRSDADFDTRKRSSPIWPCSTQRCLVSLPAKGARLCGSFHPPRPKARCSRHYPGALSFGARTFLPHDEHIGAVVLACFLLFKSRSGQEVGVLVLLPRHHFTFHLLKTF